MSLIAVPNVSEGRDKRLIDRMKSAVRSADLLDVHSDVDHDRTVLTLAGSESELVAATTELTRAALSIDLSRHRGVHPRLGVLDVCPIVPPSTEGMEMAVNVADHVGRDIGERLGLPVFLYGFAAKRRETEALPALRAGGLDGLRERMARGFVPDYGPGTIDERHGVVCVGARGPLIAFNVTLDSGVRIAREIAGRIRTVGGGPPGIRALGLWLDSKQMSQVSMNLIDPDRTGIQEAFEAVARETGSRGATIAGTEIVGLPRARYMPDPKSEAARLLIKPGRSLEEAMNA